MKRNGIDLYESQKIFEKEYEALMLEQHILKLHGYSLFEMSMMPAQDRRWTMDRIAKDQENEKKAHERSSGTGHTPGMGAS